MPACRQALRARPAAALRVTAAPDIRFVAARSGRAARRLARQSRRATPDTPATDPRGPADPIPNLTQLPANSQSPNAPTHKAPLTSLIKPHPHDPRLRRRQDQPDPHAREHPRSNYEQPPRRRRSILESGLSRRNTVLRYPTREYQSDRASRIRQARRPLSRAIPPNRRKPTGPGLTTLPPYELSSALLGVSKELCR